MQICRFSQELLVWKSGQSTTQWKNVPGGTVRSQKGDYMRLRFGGNNEATEENNQEIEWIETTQQQHSAKIIESEMKFWKLQGRRGQRQVQQRRWLYEYHLFG